mmetsp:Transcript_123335/g.360116  ORF Transcript_123335/g.360116 Transcript_123335/m.360116 type:complete len:227 (+) Transcript_123335:112-792(+)
MCKITAACLLSGVHGNLPVCIELLNCQHLTLTRRCKTSLVGTSLPPAAPQDLLHVHEHALPILLALAPLATVRWAVPRHEDTLAVLQVFCKSALVGAAIDVLHPAAPVHAAAPPLAQVLAAIGEAVAAVALHLVMPELPLVGDAVVHLVDPRAVLAAKVKLALVARPVGPALLALARLGIPLPVPLVDGAVPVHQDAISVLLVLVPFTLVCAANRIRKCPEAMRQR